MNDRSITCYSAISRQSAIDCDALREVSMNRNDGVVTRLASQLQTSWWNHRQDVAMRRDRDAIQRDEWLHAGITPRMSRPGC